MATSYSKLDTATIGSYIMTKEVMDFILTQEADLLDRKKNYIEDLLKPPNIIK